MGTIETLSPRKDLFIKKPFRGKKNGDLGLNLKKLKLLLPTKWTNSQPQHNWVSKSLELILLHLLQQTTSPQGFSQKKIQVGPSISNWNSLTHNEYFHQETFWREFRQNGNLGLNSRNWNYFYLQNESPISRPRQQLATKAVCGLWVILCGEDFLSFRVQSLVCIMHEVWSNSLDCFV